MSDDPNAVIMQKDADGNDVIRNTGDTEWITVTYRFTAPEDATYCKLFFGVAGYEAMFSCNYWFDNISVKQIDENVDATDLLFVMMQGGNATGDEEGILNVCDIVRIKKAIVDTEGSVTIDASADMNQNSKYDADDAGLLRWKLIGITMMSQLNSL